MNGLIVRKFVDFIPKRVFSPWIIWGLSAAFFFCEYFARVAPSVMASDLMRDFQVSALAYGSLSAFFYYTYVGMQVPVGVLVDRYGPHRLLTVTAILSALSCVMFAMAKNLWMADASRLLFGFAASFAFVGSLKLAAVWFPPSRFGLLAGLTQALGMIGAFVGGGPVSYAVSLIGWRETLLVIAVIFLVLAVFIGTIIRDKPLDAVPEETVVGGGLFSGLLKVLANPQTWYNALYVGLIYAPTAAFAELWGPSFIMRAYHLDMHYAASAVGMIFIGWGVGGPLIGWLSDHMRRRRPVMFFSAIFGLVLITAVIYIPHLPVAVLFLLLFLYGISNTGVATSYAVASEINPRAVSGTSIAFANMASVIIGACFQPLIGWLLDLRWDGQIIEGVPYYTADNFRMAFLQLPLCFILGIFCTFLVKETHCRPVDKMH